jgi:hypothetical protein
MRLSDRLGTVLALVAYFCHKRRWFLLPMLGVLVLAGILMLLGETAAKVSPLWYAIF